MIVRKADYEGFRNFDFFNDTDDTVRWLFRMGRNGEALELQTKGAELFKRNFNYGKENDESEQREHETPE